MFYAGDQLIWHDGKVPGEAGIRTVFIARRPQVEKISIRDTPEYGVQLRNALP